MTSIENINNIQQELSDPSSMLNNLNSTSDQFNAILDDFKKYYILYNTNQTNENTQMFSNIKSNIHKINSQLFSETSNIESSIDKINQILSQLNTEIEDAKIKNVALKQKFVVVETTNNGVTEMSENYKVMYNLQYFSNFTMILGICIAGIITYKVFKKRG
jgi:hypothetical protein